MTELELDTMGSNKEAWGVTKGSNIWERPEDPGSDLQMGSNMIQGVTLNLCGVTFLGSNDWGV